MSDTLVKDLTSSPFKKKSVLFKALYSESAVEVDRDGNATRVIYRKRHLWPVYLTAVLLVFCLCWIFITLPRRTNVGSLFDIIGNLFRPGPAFTSYSQYFHYMWYTAFPSVGLTVEMVYVATLIGCLVSVPIFILSSKNVVKHAYIYGPIRALLDIVRTLPTFVLAIIQVAFFGYSNTSGIIAMTIFTVGIMYKLMYEYTETTHMGPFEAGLSVGSSRSQAFMTGLWPQVLPTFLSNCLYTFEINVRASIILGFVGAGGVGKLISDASDMGHWDKVGALLIPIFLVTLTLQLLSSYVRRKTL